MRIGNLYVFYFRFKADTIRYSYGEVKRKLAREITIIKSLVITVRAKQNRFINYTENKPV